MKGKHLQAYILAMIAEDIKEEKTINEVYSLFEERLKKENRKHIPLSVCRYSIQQLINHGLITVEWKKIDNGCRKPIQFIQPIKPKTK